MKIYGCQMDIEWEDKSANFLKVEKLLTAAKPEKGSLVFLPEMFATGFSMNVEAIAEDPASGPTARFLSDCARRFEVSLAGGLVSRGSEGKGRNQMAVFAPDGARIALYSKIHPFTLGEESRHYVGGNSVCTFPWAGMTVSPFICYDLRFPEIFRTATRKGAELIAVVASWPFPRDEHWVTLLRARAIENQTYVIGVNRSGQDPKYKYPGRSLIVDPHGAIVADAGATEGVISADIDVNALRSYREKFPVLRDIRSDQIS